MRINENQEELRLERRRKADLVLRWFRTCACCHAVRPPIDLLCEGCWVKLEKRTHGASHLQTRVRPFPAYALFSWRESGLDEDLPSAFHHPTDVISVSKDVVGALAHGQKGGLSYKAIERLAGRMAYERAIISPMGNLGFAYPATRGRRDHAWLLAHLFQEIYGCGPVLCLSPPERFSSASFQRAKGLRERQEREFAEILDDLPKVDRWIFVDDVITSGATARAAYHALKKPPRFEVWALVDRAKLAVKDGF